MKLLEELASAQREQHRWRERAFARAAAADRKNAALAAAIGSLGRLLHDALAVDAYIDLESQKEAPGIPAFEMTSPSRRSYLPEPPSRLGLLIPGKKRAHDQRYEAAEARYKRDRQAFIAARNEHQARADRLRAEADARNDEIERYIQDFAAGQPSAIEEYFGLVLDNSEYPADFPNEAEVAFVAGAKRLRIKFDLPAIEVVPAAKAYKHDEIRDQITWVTRPRAERERLYEAALAQISLRTVHEVFTADRTNKIDSIAFEGYVDAINPSSGQPGRFCLVAFEITREQFEGLDFRQVEPLSCLKSLKARISSAPDELLAVPPLAQDDSDKEANEKGSETAIQAKRVSELEGEIQSQARQIAELEGKLEAQAARIDALESELQAEQALNAALNAENLKQAERMAAIESANQAKNYAVAQLEKGVGAQRDKNAEQASKLRDKDAIISALERRLESQSARIEELESGARGEPRPSAETQAKDPAPRDAAAELERPRTEALDDTQPIDSVSDLMAEGGFDEAELFAPVMGADPADGAGGSTIPPRESEQQSKDTSVTLRSLLVGDADEGDDEPPAPTANAEAMLEIVGRPEGNSARLLALLQDKGWRTNAAALQAEFPGEFVNVIVEDINERANDIIGENILFEDEGQWVGNEDYCRDIESVISRPEYVQLRD